MEKKVEKYEVRIVGTRPLLMHSCQHMVQDRMDEEERGKKVRESLTPLEEATKSLYIDKEGNLVVPSLCVLSCMRAAAVNFLVGGKGKKTYKNYIFSGVRVNPDNIPMISDGGWEPDLKPVVIGRARVISSRPRFDDWALEFQVEIVDPIITPSNLKAILERAGQYSGLLDFRPLYGLFEVDKFEPVKEPKE